MGGDGKDVGSESETTTLALPLPCPTLPTLLPTLDSTPVANPMMQRDR